LCGIILVWEIVVVLYIHGFSWVTLFNVLPFLFRGFCRVRNLDSGFFGVLNWFSVGLLLVIKGFFQCLSVFSRLDLLVVVSLSAFLALEVFHLVFG